MWLKKNKEGKIYFEFDFGFGKLIQGTKHFNPVEELKFQKNYGLKQIHSGVIVQAGITDESVGDGIYTFESNKFIYVKTADCLPCAMINKDERILGILHIGWRGTYLRIIQRFLNKFYTEYSINPESWEVIFGQCINKDNYEIKEDLKRLLLSSKIKGIIEKDNKIFFNLLEANIKLIEEFNITNYHIFPETEKEMFFSHRLGDKGRNIFGGFIY